MKRAYTLLLTALLLCSVLPTVLGDWVESDYVFFEASPETITSSGWVTFTLLSKQFSGDCDLVWGFDSSEIQPSTPQIWANYSHSLWRWGSELDINGTIIPVKEYYTEWFYDWKPLGIAPTKLSFQHRGMDRWFLYRDIPIVAGKVYKIRCWMNLKFPGLEEISGKYFFGMKRSIDTVQEAISSGRFFLLDPWYDSSWIHRLKITFDNSASSENLTDFPVMVKLDSSNFDFSLAQESGADLYPTDSDGNTSLAYEIEEYNYTAESAILWIKVPQIDANSTTDHLFLYYGNSEASSSEDPEAVWGPNSLMVQHFEESTNATCADSTSNNNDGVPTPLNSPPTSVSIGIDGALEFDGVEEHVLIPSSDSMRFWETFTFTGLINVSDNNQQQMLLSKWGGGDYYFQILGTGKYEMALIGPSGGCFVSTEVWDVPIGLSTFHAVYDGPGATASIYINGVNETDMYSAPVPPTIHNNTAQHQIAVFLGNLFFKGAFSELRYSEDPFSSYRVYADYLSMTNSFISYGEPELCDYTLELQILGSGPIEGATLSLSGEGETYYDVSDSEGWVNLVVPWGSYEITISHAGYYVNPVTFFVDRDLYGPAGLLGVEEGVTITTSPEVLGLFILSIVMQIIYFALLYSDKSPVLSFIVGPLTSVTWYTTAQTVLVINPTIGVPISYLLYLFSTLNIIPIFGIVYSILAPREKQ